MGPISVVSQKPPGRPHMLPDNECTTYKIILLLKAYVRIIDRETINKILVQTWGSPPLA